MQCLPTKLFYLALILLAGCGSQPAGPTVPLYIETVQLKEKLASQQFANGNYQEALDAYQGVYLQYLKIDSHIDMARLLTNRFQTALIIEDIHAAKRAQTDLQALLLQSQENTYPQRLLLLSANLAIVEQQWQQALSLLAQMPPNTSADIALAARISAAIAGFHQGDDVSPQLRALTPAVVEHPALTARTQRLQASINLQNGTHNKTAALIKAAKAYYQGISFPPGVAECLVLEAKLANNNGNTNLAKQLEHRAKSIFLLLGNTHAITRHTL